MQINGAYQILTLVSIISNWLSNEPNKACMPMIGTHLSAIFQQIWMKLCMEHQETSHETYISIVHDKFMVS